MRKVLDGLLEHPVVYRLWQAPFAEQKFAPAWRRLENVSIGRVLDVGCGPGTNARRFGSAEYVGVDINDRYLEMGRRRFPGQFVQADLATADLHWLGRFDTILVNSFLHHLPDSAVNRILGQIATLLADEGSVHILELVRPTYFCPGSIMARLDRGRFARHERHWRILLSEHFHAKVIEPYKYAGGLWHMLYFQGTRKCASR
jgi:SAM-dependent methyltransferase